MTALLTDNLPLLADAPNGIKKLRELILELAVRGKLLPQDPRDEPACELLKRIAEEKARLIAEGALKKQKTLPEVSEEERLFDLPQGWAWCRLQDAFDVRDGTHDSPKYQSSGYPLVTSKNLYTGKLDLTDVKFISEEDHQKISARSKVDRGDVLFAMIGSIGNPAIVDTDVPFSIKNVALLKQYVPGKISPDFLLIYLLVAAADMREKSAGGVQSFVSLGSIRLYPFALPALNEQHRIVAKVDELMALCDRLETQQADAATAHAQLVQALLGSLTQASDATEFAANWQRLAEHFHTLFITEPSIDALKQTLLQLAVMGKVVPQDANDEPAEKLYERIQAERQRLVTEGVLKKQKPLAEIVAEDIQLKLPSTWKWVPLLEITTGMDSGWSPACLGNSSTSDDVWGVLKTTAVQIMSYREHENKELPSHLEPRPEAEAKAGDILFTRAGPMNRVGISCLVESTRPKLMISDKIIRFHPVELGAFGRFIALCLNSGETAKYLEQAKSGMAASQVNISQGKLRMAPIPLAPLSEQHRIVAKVDQLMALCDQLKTCLIQARQLNEQLASTLVEQAVA